MAVLKHRIPRRLSGSILALLCVLISCASAPRSAASDAAGGEATLEAKGAASAEAGEIAAMRDKMLAAARSLIGVKYNAKGVVVNGKSFTIDCIGTVSAAFWAAGIDITKDFYKYTGNGVACLFYELTDRGSIKSGKDPAVGDIVFWDNTWDRNGDGVFGNDPLTHAGIIMQVDEDGTAYYLHASVSAGVTIERMNLRQPGVWKDGTGKVINSGIYIASWYGNPKNPAKWTAGDLFRAFGDGTKILLSFSSE